MRASRAVLAGIGGLLLAGAALAQVAVRIQSPTADQPVFGPTEVNVGVAAGEKVDKVDLFVNLTTGQRGLVTSPRRNAWQNSSAEAGGKPRYFSMAQSAFSYCFVQ